MSLPLWERGLKFRSAESIGQSFDVAPLVGAWIEIINRGNNRSGKLVAPLVGAWIEMGKCRHLSVRDIVAPLVGAWIEIK